MRKTLVVSLLLGLGLGACGGGGLEGEVKDWKEKMCKCSDKGCAEKTWDDYKEWRSGKREAAKDMSKDQIDKLKGIEKEMKECRDKLRDGDKGGEKAPEGGAKAPEGGDKPAAP